MAWKLAELLTNLTSRVEQLKELPPVPEVARAILQLRDDPNADAKRLAQVVQLDPSLSAQLMRYANSAFFGYRGKLESIQDAISRVLGFDRAMHIALGVAAGKALSHSKDGPLGIRAFWHHAVFSATLMQILNQHLPAERRPPAGLVYLAGLVHDIGFLLLGHVLEAEFNILNKAMLENPDTDVIELEERLFGTTHQDLGVCLLRKWKLPPEILAAVYAHHNVRYQGEHRVFPNLALVADRLLRVADRGTDAAEAQVPEKLLASLGLKQEHLDRAIARIHDEKENLDATVSSLAAA